MSLLQRLKAAQLSEQAAGGGGGLPLAVSGGGAGGTGAGSSVTSTGVEPPRRQSMAVKTLAVPTQGPGRRTSGGQTQGQGGPRTSSSGQSSGGRPSQSSGGRTSQSGPRASVAVGGAFGGLGGGARGIGPSLIGLLASKRLAKRFATRFHNRHTSKAVPVQKEPSYRLEPHCKFNPDKVEAMLKSVLEERLGKMRYSPKICPNMCKILGDDIKQRVKHMNFDRYKIVSNVMIGQQKNQGMVFCSRCAWDDKLDNYAAYTFQNEHIFCTATVFAVYTE